MSRLVLAVQTDGSPRALAASRVLRLAQDTLRLLRALERERTGKAPRIPWQVEILTLHDQVVMRWDAPGTGWEPFAAAAAEATLAMPAQLDA